MSIGEFREYLTMETEFLSNAGQIWTTILNQDRIPEEAKGHIKAILGKSNMLVSKKFEFFNNLINQCEQGNHEPSISCNDLQGYWDGIMIQVDDIKRSYKDLAAMRENKWKVKTHK